MNKVAVCDMIGSTAEADLL